MPDRYLRQSILMSKAVNSLTTPAEKFYRRLMSVVDDFGRLEADPTVLLPACYPLQLTTRMSDIALWRDECATAGLILLYEVDGKEYLWFLKTDPPRAKSSKYPPHPSDNRPCIVKRAHVDTCAHVRPYSSSNSSTRTQGESPGGKDPVDGDELDDRIRAFIGPHRMLNYSPAGHSHFRQMVEAAGWEKAERAISDAIANGASEPFSYAKKVLSGMQAKARLKQAANGASTLPGGDKPKAKAVRI